MNPLVASVLAAAVLTSTLPAAAQAPPGADTQQKVAALKQSIADNQQKLRQYQWTETTQLNLNGNDKPPSQSSCRYGPDGKEVKTPMGPPPQPPQPSGGRLKQKIVANKKEEMKDYMGQVKTLLGLYLPPDPQKIQQSAQSGNVSITPGATTSIVFKNYALPGDQMTVSFNSAEKKIAAIQVNTYMDDPKDTVTLNIQFASLPDSTNYVQQTVLVATAKKLKVTTTNSNYQPASPQ
jgi:hypothetical protein